MSIIDEYISQHFSERLCLDVTEEDITWQLRGSRSDYVNTRIQFDREKLMAVMDVMLSGLDSDETTLARCRQVLTLWIAGLDMLSKEAEQPDWLPRVHPHSSGQCDLLLKGNPAALTEADEETYLRVTGQQDLPAHRRIPQVIFSKTVRYWHRFESWLAQQLQDITQHCYQKLKCFVANCTTEPRQLREFRGEYGSLRLFVGPQDIDEIDILEFNPEYIVSWVDKVADGLFTPVCFVVNVYYKNGILLESFTWDSEVDNINRMTSSDYGEAMSQAISWVREQFEQPVIDQPVPQQPRLAA
ncbi:hypothetical protein CAJ82_10615 [Salmonella enterica subsp. enterica serovar Typhi]|uniref:Uncharacterized protein n=10 Tax=Salmonella enterica TaxID=28901 RepID=A0A3Y4N4B8_SALET|nr:MULTISPECIES: hypothetical protein [Salmonella]pir/AG1033/ hypothetical protein STY4594 [imported] - Salmonella enterica subsp. enterica serovar Typhi (strain CT18) [Salmonella enterica subsp. enterica serovar Typhi]EBH2513711.1 hypothetical protein [Salmonella enterica subsp. enterica serovar Enteritidis]ECE6939316.1 hypothetical protein [Salmonella enterica subsp. enterica serovar Choleraesuis]ECK9414948.1 hypothetical protein [Salmonella enterica subsp. enterica serovar Paratyphi C str. C